MSEPSLRSGLRRRIVGVALLAGLAGATSAVIANLSFQHRTITTVIEQSWRLSGRDRFLARCEASGAVEIVREEDGLELYAYDAAGRSRSPTAPALSPERFEQARRGPPAVEILGGRPWGGQALLRASPEPDSPCAFAP